MVLAIVAVAYLVLLRKSEDGGSVPKWLAIVGIVVAVLLVCVMGHSYMMSARPVWDNVFWVASLLGNACVFGPITLAVIMNVTEGGQNTSKFVSTLSLGGSAVNVVTTALCIVFAVLAASGFVSVGHYFDSTHPTNAFVDASAFGPFADGIVAATLVALIAALCAVVMAFVARKRAGKQQLVFWGIALACAAVGAVALRVAFYQMGGSFFIIF